MESKISQIYRDLRAKHGHPQGQWRLWCRRPKTRAQREEVVIGSILTQNTNWQNVEKAIASLKEKKFLSLRKIAGLRKNEIAPIIRSAGFFNQKSGYLLSVANYIEKNGGMGRTRKKKLGELRQELLALKGVGPETADSILLYSLDKPIFVIDEYTRRFVKRKKLTKNLDYRYLQKYFQKRLPKSFQLYQDFHALIVIDGKRK